MSTRIGTHYVCHVRRCIFGHIITWVMGIFHHILYNFISLLYIYIILIIFKRKINRFGVSTIYGTQCLLYHIVQLYVHFHSTRRCVVTVFVTMNNDEIVEALWSSDEFSEFDDSDADPDFTLVNIA